MRTLFAQKALDQIPKLLTLLDRNPHSPTYGCFDRNYWHYKIIDFPSGMAQEFVWPLALAYHTPTPHNPFHKQAAIKTWVQAGIQFAARSAHPDGSCDDYFPFERASGAAAFSLLACLESYRLFGFDDPKMLTFFEQRANWLATHEESGRLTNHHALIVLCLERLSHLLQTNQWDRAKSVRLERILDWQSDEGWFPEYEGCDPGYHTLTLSCLAWLEQMRPNPQLREAIARGVNLAAEFVHPDGSYGGEYTSRNTHNFFPHGFELIGRWYTPALSINDQFLEGLNRGLGACYADDHILGHHTWNYFLAWRDYVPARPPRPPRPTGQIWLPQAQLLIDRRQNTELYLALNKGGVFKLFRDRQLVASDTQLSLQVKNGHRIRNAVAHLVDHYTIDLQTDEISIQGHLGWAKQTTMTPLNLLILRIVMLTFGRFFPNLIRRILQQLLIVGKRNAPFSFHRHLVWQDSHWTVTDTLQSHSWKPVLSIGLGSDQTSIYVVMSRTFHPSQLQPWYDLSEKLLTLTPGQPLSIKRQL